MADETRPRRFAVLIDADNTSPRIAAGLFEEIAKFGEPSVRRIYGDFSSPRLRAWADLLQKYAIDPYQQFAYTSGKNASDIALVIDAMDLLHSRRFDGFVLVSSDSDFTRLAARIREQGLDVYGFGEQKTPESFRRACKRFIYTENLLPPGDGSVPAEAEAGGSGATSGSSKRPPAAAIPHICTALSQLDDVDGWHFLGAVGTRLAALMPDFDPRTYGCPKLLTLIEKSDAFEVRRENLKVYIRPKQTRSP